MSFTSKCDFDMHNKTYFTIHFGKNMHFIVTLLHLKGNN